MERHGCIPAQERRYRQTDRAVWPARGVPADRRHRCLDRRRLRGARARPGREPARVAGWRCSRPPAPRAVSRSWTARAAPKPSGPLSSPTTWLRSRCSSTSSPRFSTERHSRPAQDRELRTARVARRLRGHRARDRRATRRAAANGRADPRSRMGVALDDVGADPTSLAFMSLLRPEVVKLDLRLIQQRPNQEIAAIMHAVNAYTEASGAAAAGRRDRDRGAPRRGAGPWRALRAGLAVRTTRNGAQPASRRRCEPSARAGRAGA